MRTRRSRARTPPVGARYFSLLEVRPDRTRIVSLSVDQPHLVSGEEGWEVTLAARDDGTVEVRSVGGAAIRVNDVQVRGNARARPGDFIALPDRSVLVQAFSTLSPPTGIISSHESFELRLVEEVERAAPTRSAVSVLVVRSRALLEEGLQELLSAPEFQALRRGERPLLMGLAAPATL